MSTTQDIQECQPFRLPDLSVGDPNGPNPLEGWTWEELRDRIYEEVANGIGGGHSPSRTA